MLLTVKGLVVRETVASDNLKYIQVLTAERGRLSVLVRGSTRSRGRFSAPTQIFCYSELVLYEHNGKYSLNDASLIQNYFVLCEDYDVLTVGAYVLNTAEYLMTEEQPDGGVLRLALNTLWMLTHRKERDIRLIKGAYELRLASLAGFAPNLVCCESCGAAAGSDVMFLNVMEGTLTCRACTDAKQNEIAAGASLPIDEDRTAQIILPLPPAVQYAMQYALFSDMSRLFSFTLGDELIPVFSKACETYLENHVEHHFEVLDTLTW